MCRQIYLRDGSFQQARDTIEFVSRLRSNNQQVILDTSDQRERTSIF
ncbi:MAG: hypothetical protein ABGZ23_19390 [Fuerstiella sp.]